MAANKKKMLIINGPNMNMLGTREPEIYGAMTLDELVQYTEKRLVGHDVSLEWFQSNFEGQIIEKIHVALEYDALIINPAAYSHTSVAIYDALKILDIPIIEVHMSNTHARDGFRSRKLTAKASTIIMEGLGVDAYYIAAMSQL